MSERVTCKRQHQLFQVVAEGIEIKCRHGRCNGVHLVTRAELEEKWARLEQVSVCAILQEKQEIVCHA